MAKRHINLIIHRDTDSPLVKKLRIYLPIAAGFSLIFFIAGFAFSYIYVRSNATKFALLKRDVEAIEKRVNDNKNTEGIYTLTASALIALENLSKIQRNHMKVFSEVADLQDGDIRINTVSNDVNGNVSFGISASSVDTLSAFIDKLLIKEETDHVFSSIRASGIVRDKSGGYVVTIITQVSPSLLQ